MTKLTRAQIAELSATIIARGITVEGLGEATGLGAVAVQQVMQGRLLPSEHFRKRLAAALGIDPRLIS